MGESNTSTPDKSQSGCGCIISGFQTHAKKKVNKEAFANRVFPRSYPQSKIDMIELVSESRCIECNLCVNVCPTNVFDKVPDAPPIIARQSDCQTCFMCELYCPVDALYVAPQVEPLESVDEKSLKETGLLGSYRNNIGWGRDKRSLKPSAYRTNTAKQDSTHLILKQLK